MTTTPYAVAAEKMYREHSAKWFNHPRAHLLADWHRFMSAAENADDTSVEEGFERGSAPWYEIWCSSYGCLCDDGAYDDEYEAA